MSKIPGQIRKITFSPAKINKMHNYGNNSNNIDNNLIKDKIISSKENTELMKGSKSNRNKLNIFHSPRNQIIKHFKESLNKTSEENNINLKSKYSNNKILKTKSSKKILSSNKTENPSKQIDEALWDSLFKKNIIFLNKKNFEKISNAENEKDFDSNINNKNNDNQTNKKESVKSVDQQRLLLQKKLSLDNFLTHSKDTNLDGDSRKFKKDLKELKQNLSNNKNEKTKNGLEESHSNYNIDDQIEKEFNSNSKNIHKYENIFCSNNNNYVNNNDSYKKYSTSKTDCNIRYPENKENNSEITKIINSDNSKLFENNSTKKTSKINSLEVNHSLNNNEKITLPFNNNKYNKQAQKSSIVSNTTISNYYSNYNPKLFGKKVNPISKSINISNIHSKKKLNIDKNLSYANSKNLMSEKILNVEKKKNPNSNEPRSNNNKKENSDIQTENSNLKELEKIIYSERNSLAKKKSMDKILSARKFLNVNRNPSTVNFNIANPKSSKEFKPLNTNSNNKNNNNNANIRNEKNTHFNSMSIANIISPHKLINLSQNFETNFIEINYLKSNKSNKNIINYNKSNNNNNTFFKKPQKKFISASHDFMNHFKNNLSQTNEFGKSSKNKALYDFKTERKNNYSNNYANGLDKISLLKSIESISSNNKYSEILNSFSRGNTYNAYKSEDYTVNKNLNKEIFSQLKHLESIKHYDLNLNSNYKTANNNLNGNEKTINFLDKKDLNSADALQNLNYKKNQNGGTENGFNSDYEINNNDLPKSFDYETKINNSSNAFGNDRNIKKAFENNQNPFPLQNEIVFEKEKSNLINLNTYTLLKKQRNKNSLLANEILILQENIQEELESPDLHKNKGLFGSNNLPIEIDYERKLTKESALQSNIELNVDIEENSINNINTSLNIKNNNNNDDKNSIFKKSEKLNSSHSESNVINTNFNNKSFGAAEINFNFNDNYKNNHNNKEKENYFNRKKTKDLLDAIIPSPAPKKKEKTNFADLIKDLKQNSNKFSPLKKRDIEINNLIRNKKLNADNNLISYQNSDKNLNAQLSIMEIRVERPYKNNELNEILCNQYLKNESENESNCKINKINKFDLKILNEISANSLITQKDKLAEINKISGKDLSNNSFIQTLKNENINENTNLDFHESPIKLRKISNNDLIYNNIASQMININNEVNFPIQENSQIVKNKASNGNNAEIAEFPFKKESFNIKDNFQHEDKNPKNNNINEKDFSTLNNIYKDLININDSNQTIKKESGANLNSNNNNNDTNLHNPEAQETDHIAFRKINYNIDTNNNFRNKHNAINIINNKKSELENLTSENKTLNNNSNKVYNMYRNLNRDKNSNTLSTLFNENEFTGTNKHNGIYQRNQANIKERKNKNSLNNFAEEYKNKLTNITDISLKANFTVSSIITENNENKNSELNKNFGKIAFRNENIFINDENKANVDAAPQVNKTSLNDLDEEMIANEIPVNFNSVISNKHKNSKISGLKFFIFFLITS